MMLMGVMPALPKIWFTIFDVRDVAQAHLIAIKVHEAANKRFALCGDTYTFKELCEKIIEKYGDNTSYSHQRDGRMPAGECSFKERLGTLLEA